MDATHRFSDRVHDYVLYRPRYPRELVPLLTKHTGLDPSWIVADVGSGTGISAGPFIQNGNRVFAIEPNAEMRGAGEKEFAGSSNFVSVNGTAEDTTLDSRSVDLVIAGQAFHWFDVARTGKEFRRILRSPCWTALFWNTRRTDSSPFLQAYESLLLRHGTDYGRVRHDHMGADVLSSFFQHVHRCVLPYEQSLDLKGLTGRLFSSSYTPPEGDARRPLMLEELERIFLKHQENGTVRLVYDTEVYVGEL